MTGKVSSGDIDKLSRKKRAPKKGDKSPAQKLIERRAKGGGGAGYGGGMQFDKATGRWKRVKHLK